RPVIVFDATPDEAVAEPRPETEPAPPDWLKLTEVELSEVARLPLASSSAAVIARVAPVAGFVVALVITTCVSAPGTTVNVVVPSLSPATWAVRVTEPAPTPVSVFDATPEAAVAEPRPETEPVPPLWLKLTEVELSVVTTFPLASSSAAV